MDIYEFSIKDKVDYETLRNCISEHFELNVDSVLPEDEFWDQIGIDPIAIGLAVTFADNGFRTFARLYVQSGLTDYSSILLASNMATRFNCDVAVGDFTDECEQASERFLVICPEESIARATAFENGDTFSLDVEPAVESINAFLDRID